MNGYELLQIDVDYLKYETFELLNTSFEHC